MPQPLTQTWKKPKASLGTRYKQLLVDYRAGSTITRLEKPSRLERARRLGYKAKQGVFVVRVQVPMGRRMRPKPTGGRRPKAYGRYYPLDKSKQQVAEEKASRKFRNCEALGSYWVGKDGVHQWFEVILLDRAHPAVTKDKQLSLVARKRGRAFRGLTSAGRKSRGLR